MDEARYREAERLLWEGVGVTPTEQRLHLERTRVTVRVQEVGEGPPVVFVHGASVSGSSWATLAAGLTGFRCILLDRPGTGLSDPLDTPLTPDTLPGIGDSLLVDVLDALGLQSAHLVATSFGGYFALRAAAAHPDRIGRMVQFSWPVGAPISRVPMIMRLSAIPLAGRLIALLPPSERMIRMGFRQIGHAESVESGRISQELIDWFLALQRHTDTTRQESRLTRGTLVSAWARRSDPPVRPVPEHDSHADSLHLGREGSLRRRRHCPPAGRSDAQRGFRALCRRRARALVRRARSRRQEHDRIPPGVTERSIAPLGGNGGLTSPPGCV